MYSLFKSQGTPGALAWTQQPRTFRTSWWYVLKLLWSSRSQKFIGHAMTLLSLCYTKSWLQTVLQMLWCDLTSGIGPHFTSYSPFAHEFLCHIWILFVAVVCDGAAPVISKRWAHCNESVQVWYVNITIGECTFGWSVIEDMYNRVISRITSSQRFMDTSQYPPI